MVLLAALEISLRLAGYGYDPHFFKRIKIGNEDCYVQNDDFSYRFFPPETARNPGPMGPNRRVLAVISPSVCTKLRS